MAKLKLAVPTVKREGASFSDYLTKHPNLDELTFPYGPQGVRQYARMRAWFWPTVILFSISLVSKLLSVLVPLPTHDALSMVSQFVPALSWPNLVGLTLKGLGHLSTIAFVVGGVCFAICAFMAVIYGLYAVARWQNFERGVFLNDMKAEKIRRSVLKATNAKIHAKEAKRKKSDQPSQDEKAKIEAKKAVLGMKVFVNTRPSLDSDHILRYFQIKYDVPFDQDVAAALQPDVEKMGPTAVKVTSGKVNFGQMIQSSDRLSWYFTDQQVVKAKERKKPREKKSEEKRQASVEYEYAFPLTMFKDLRPVIRQKTEQAERWGRSKAKALDSVFSTDGTQALRTNLVVSAASVMVEYNLSLDLRLDNIESKEKMIDKAFKISGTTLVISDTGALQVTIPLPKQFRLPIDVASMYVETFGRPSGFKDD